RRQDFVLVRHAPVGFAIDSQLASIWCMQCRAWRRRSARIVFEIELRARTHGDRVRASAGRELFLSLAAQSNAVEMPLERARLGRGVITLARGFIYSVNRCDFPRPLRQLAYLLAVGGIQKEVTESIALAGPQELLPAINETRLILDVDPVLVGFF